MWLEADCNLVSGEALVRQIVYGQRFLREEFGRRVKRSAYTRSATAIGLAIQADASAGYEFKEQFTRWFGVIGLL